MNKISKTAVVIFAHSSEYEAKVKPFRHSKEVFDSLNHRTLQIVKKTKLPYFLLTEKEQVGANFGERFTNAIQSIYDLGYECVITVGNDTPHLTSKQIVAANAKLAKNETVLGLSTDGGFYLLGIKKEHFDADLFLKLPWQSQNLSQSLSKLFIANSLKINYLKKLSDVDTYQDIEKIVNSFKKVYHVLFQLFLKIIASRKELFLDYIAISSSQIFSHLNNKGSPVSI